MEFREQHDSYVKLRGYDYSTGNSLAEESDFGAGTPGIFPNIEKYASDPEKMDYSPEEFLKKVESFESSILEEAEKYGRTMVKKYGIELENDEGVSISTDRLEDVEKLFDEGYDSIKKAHANYMSVESNSAPQKGHMVEDFSATVRYLSPGKDGMAEFPARMFSRVEINRPFVDEYRNIMGEMEKLFPAGS